MKVLVVIILMTILQAKASVTFAQKINLNEKNVTLLSIIEKIRQQSGYDFVYNEDLINGYKNLQLSIANGTVEEALNQSLKNLALTYTIDNKLVVIKRRSSPPNRTNLLVADTLIKGVVIDDATKKPVPGVTITLKGRTAVTGEDGTFTINGGTIGATLTAKFIGYKTFNTVLTPSNISQRISIRLEESGTELKAVEINNGLFTRESNKSTGITKTITGADLRKAGTVNLVQSLRNIDPSFMVIENLSLGSDPNALPEINLRGATGLPDLNGEFAANPNLPLFILDGFETSLRTILNLDLYRIASINILKDAASKAPYGSRAGNGVIVIETIRPAVGQLQISYNSNFGYEAPDLSSYNLANAEQKLQAELAAGIFNANTATIEFTNTVNYNERLKQVMRGVDVDWMHKPLQNALTQRHSLNISGGDQSFLYGITTSYNGVDGVMKGSGRDNLEGNIQLTYRPKSKKALGATNYNISISNNLSLNSDKSVNSPWGSFSTYATANPYVPYTNADGSLTSIVKLGTIDFDNPAYNATLNTFDRGNTTTITNNTSLNATLFKGFIVNGRFSFSKGVGQTDVFLPALHTSFNSVPATASSLAIPATPAARRGSYRKSYNNTDSYGGQLILTYAKAIKKNTITLNASTDMQENSQFGNGYLIEGFPNDRLDIPSLGLQYALNSRLSGTENTTRSVGLSGVINYSYDNKYVLDGSYNGTQSSQFGENSRWGQFWSIGARWNVDQESFIEKIKWIDQLSIQATTGYTGTQGFNSSMSLGTYQYSADGFYSNGNGASLTALANPDLKWQRVKENNFQIQIALFKKFRASFNPYIRNTAGALTDISLPPSTGFATYKANLGRIENKGYQANLSYSIFQKGRNYLNLTAGFQYNKNILKELSNSLVAYNKRVNALSSGTEGNPGQVSTSVTAAQISRPKVLFVEGQSIDAIYAVRSLGIDPSTGRELFQKLDGTVTYEWNINDQVPVGNTIPKFNGNFGFNFSYNGFLVNTSFRLTLGGQVYNTTLLNKVENADITRNVDLRLLTERWQKPGDVKFFKNIADQTATRVTSRFVENNNVLTLGALNVTYELDRIAAIRKMGLSRLRAGLSTSELFTLQSTQVERGTTYPFARNIQFTLNANF